MKQEDIVLADKIIINLIVTEQKAPPRTPTMWERRLVLAGRLSLKKSIQELEQERDSAVLALEKSRRPMAVNP